MLAEFGVSPGRPILDAACGIGTQALGLAGLGYQLTASDLSRAAVARARDEALRRGLRIRSRSLRRPERAASFREAGFATVARRDDHFFQPLLVATVPAR